MTHIVVIIFRGLNFHAIPFLSRKIEKKSAFFHLFHFRGLKNEKLMEEMKQKVVKRLAVGTVFIGILFKIKFKELLQLAIKEDRFRQTLEKKMNRPGRGGRRGRGPSSRPRSSRPRSAKPVESKVLPIKFDLRSDIHIE